MGVASSRESCVSAKVQISIFITLCNFGQDGLDTLTFTTPHGAVYPIERRVIWAWLRQITQHLATQELGTCIYLRLFGMFTNPEFLEL